MNIVRMMIVFGSLAIIGRSQASVPADHEDFQSWNDVQINVSLNEKFEYFNRFTMRLGENVSRFNDGRIAVGIVWKPTRAISISPFLWLINARNALGSFRRETRLNLSATYRFPFKKFGLSHRSTIERRLRFPLNSWRYRAMVTVEKDIPKSIIPGAKVFVADEVFYDSLLKQFSRNRFAVGITKTLSKQLAVDIFYMRQNDGFARPGDLNTIWTAWKIKY